MRLVYSGKAPLCQHNAAHSIVSRHYNVLLHRQQQWCIACNETSVLVTDIQVLFVCMMHMDLHKNHVNSMATQTTKDAYSAFLGRL